MENLENALLEIEFCVLLSETMAIRAIRSMGVYLETEDFEEFKKAHEDICRIEDETEKAVRKLDDLRKMILDKGDDSNE